MGKTVLIIDDSDTIRGRVRDTLLGVGLFSECIEAEDGLAGFKALSSNSVDLVICDVVMPGADGFKFLLLRKTQPHLAQVPVIMLTSQDNVDTVVRCLEAGAADHVGKPFRDEELLARARVHTSLRESHQRLEEALVQLEGSRGRLENIMRSLADALIVLDKDERIIRINDRFVELFGYAEDSVINKPLSELLPNGELLGLIGAAATFAGESVVNMNAAFLTASGEWLPTTVSGAIVRDGHGDVQGYVLVAHDRREVLRALAQESRAVAAERQKTEELTEARDQLRLTEFYLENILSSMADGLLVLNADETIRRGNDAISSLLGYSEEELEGRQFGELLEGDDLISITGIGQMLRSRPVQGLIVSLSSKSGDRIAASLSGSVMSRGPDDIECFVLLIRDTREFHEVLADESRALAAEKELAEELANAHASLRVLGEERNHFFQSVSHELRTPLTLILNSLDSISGAEGHAESLAIARNHSRRMLRLVNQLLDFQKLSAKKHQLSLEPVLIAQFMSQSAEQFRAACNSQGISLLVTIDGDTVMRGEVDGVDVAISADLDALEKVVFNFLSNALKFTEFGGIIEVGMRSSPEQVVIFVRDTGVGISSEDQAKLFQLFTQVGQIANRRHDGTGLGLALVKELTESMHGTVEVASTLGQGSTFSASFPRIQSSDEVELIDQKPREWMKADVGYHEEPREVHSRQVCSVPEQDYILVIDDIPDMCQVIRRSLEGEGYEVATAHDGRTGLELAELKPPSLVIVDWLMPGMNGPQFIAKFKSEPNFVSVPIILLTAKSDEETRLIGAQIGADGFLGKPFDARELHSMVRNLLRLKTRETEIAIAHGELSRTMLELENANRQLREQSFRDPLTGLYNRRYLREVVDDTISNLSDTSSEALYFVLMDLDHFKRVNDVYGHDAGDLVLIEAARRLCVLAGENDLVIRWGGEEILFVHRGPRDGGGRSIAREVKRVFNRGKIHVGGGSQIEVSASIGVVRTPFTDRDDDVVDWDDLLTLADHALYAAKRNGRDMWIELSANEDTPSEGFGQLIRSSASDLVTRRLVDVTHSLSNVTDLVWD
ncbi:MAG: response regulator [Myxococcota bacterium]|nr:response regulator [Myxococcota bacterium]